MSNELIRLRQFLVKFYNLDELRTLCFDLGIDHEELGEGAKSSRVRELLLLMGRECSFDRLLPLLRQSRPEPFINIGISTDSAFLDKLYAQLPSIKVEGQRPRNELLLMRKVETFWVKGVLEESLRDTTLINLGKEDQPEAISNPWKTIVHAPNSGVHEVPPDKRVIDLYDESGGGLLVLGAPGSGKTTLLLDLAREAIARAEEYPDPPVPVVFNLSSWTSNDNVLEDWLVIELSEKYLIPRGISQSWVEEGRLLLLLDGLDEVRPELQEACVEAINRYRQEYLLGMVVCSRTDDYIQIGRKLKLDRAVFLKPLGVQQIKEHLASFGPDLSILNALLQTDASLQELAKSPLILNIMAQVYRNVLPEELQLPSTDMAHHRWLFDTYIKKMFSRRMPSHEYKSTQTTQRLAWLAQKMLKHGQTVFLIEKMQPDWLSSRKQKRLYSSLVVLVIGAFFGLLGGLFGWLAGIMFGGLIFSLHGGLGGAMVVGFVFAVASVLGGGINIIVDRKRLVLSRLRMRTPIELFRKLTTKIYLAERLKWSWTKAKEGFVIVVTLGLSFGLVTGLIDGFAIGLTVNPAKGIIDGLTVGVFFGLGGIMFLGLLSGLEYGEIERKSKPNQGIWLSAQSAIRVGLVFGLAFMLSGILFSVLFGNLSSRQFGGIAGAIFFGVFFGLSGACYVALVFGGKTVVQHTLLRLVLFLSRTIPLDLVDFLNYSVERIFLRRVGGGYIFIHRVLIEYFAKLEID